MYRKKHIIYRAGTSYGFSIHCTSWNVSPAGKVRLLYVSWCDVTRRTKNYHPEANTERPQEITSLHRQWWDILNSTMGLLSTKFRMWEISQDKWPRFFKKKSGKGGKKKRRKAPMDKRGHKNISLKNVKKIYKPIKIKTQQNELNTTGW